VALHLEGRRCLVVGGGELAAHRVRDLLACGAVVTVVAEHVSDAMGELDVHGAVSIEVRDFEPSDVTGQLVVFAASGTDELDAEVARAARRHGVLVNRSDTPEDCDFFHTSVHRAGPVTVSVSSSGTSPALARWLRRRLAAQVGPEFGALALLLAELRDSMHAEGASSEGLDWDALLDELAVALPSGDAASVRSTVARWRETTR
jgi:precorrin-2 dehydrogenase/sirohydrochlorin ferrochelatase